MSKDLFMAQREFEAMPISKATVKKQIEAVKRDLDLGMIVPKVAYIQAKVIKDIAEGIMEVAKPLIENLESVDLPQNLSGVELSERSGWDNLDYDSDPVYKALKEQLKEREGLLKSAYNHSRSFGLVMVDENGEALPIVPVKSVTKSALIVKY